MNDFNQSLWKKELSNLVGKENLLLLQKEIKPFATGIRVGKGKAEAVIFPISLLQIWQILKIALKNNLIIIMQAANTGLTGGSTPDGENYDRKILIINTLKIDKIIYLNNSKQIIAFAGSALYKLEELLEKENRSPHSIIGSSCIGASIVGGVCNNSGGNLLKRGPAFTELSIFAKIDKNGELKLVNNLEVNLGDTPEEILTNLEKENFSEKEIMKSNKLASDKDYERRVRDINSSEPARYNSDKRRLFEASGCAGKIAVFAVRLDTFKKENSKKIFFLGTNNPDNFTKLREKVLSKVDNLPDMAEYMHKSFFEASEKYCKDNFLIIKNLGTQFLPKLFSIKRRVDNYLAYLSIFDKNISDNFLQKITAILPNHLPQRVINFRKNYEHFLIISSSDESILEIREILNQDKEKKYDYEFFECNKQEGDALLLHRYVAGGAPKRIKILEDDNVGNIVAFDVALPRNCQNWHEIINDEILKDMSYQFKMGHFFCMVFHWDFILKKNIDQEKVKSKMLSLFKKIHAKFPAEHNVGHIYSAEDTLVNHYKDLDPTNSFNSGIGKTSKNKNYL
tara:strand:+ start:5999 stop:7699 length:1701 start_codon:yes stop_codon:yes gene_type:complete